MVISPPPHTTPLTLTDKSMYALSYRVLSPLRHCEPEPNVQVKVNKRCLWILWVTNSNLCLHSSCNYLLTDLILAVKWLAKSMCTQTRPESMEVHAIYLLAPSHNWYIAINEPDRKDTRHDLTGHEPDKHDDWLLTHRHTQKSTL